MDSRNETKTTLQYILRDEDVLRVSTFGGRSPAESTIKFFEEFEINRGYLRSKVSELFGCLRAAAASPPGSGGGGEGEKARIRDLGEDLYRELVPSSLRAKISEAAGAGLLLAVDGSLAWIPWELLHDGNGFFCNLFDMGRIVTLPVSSGRVEKKDLDSPLRHVIIADPAGGLRGAAKEGAETLELLLSLGMRARPVLLSGRVGETGFLDGLKGAGVFHFAGHLDEDDGGARFRLHGGSCTTGQIRKLNGRFPFPPLVFLNGCRSFAAPLPERLEAGQDRAFGLASTFLECGSRHVVGTLWDMRDDLAAAAGTAFFRSLYGGESVGAALRETRSLLLDDFGFHAMAWAGYVLYGDPSFRIPSLGDPADLILRHMEDLEGRRSSLRVDLESDRPRERFLAAAALLQLGDRASVPVLREEIGILFDLLESESFPERRRGEAVLGILGGGDLGYGASRDPEARRLAVARVREWWRRFSGESRFPGT